MIKIIKSEFCKGCIHWPCGDIEDSDTEILDCDYREGYYERRRKKGF